MTPDQLIEALLEVGTPGKLVVEVARLVERVSVTEALAEKAAADREATRQRVRKHRAEKAKQNQQTCNVTETLRNVTPPSPPPTKEEKKESTKERKEENIPPPNPHIGANAPPTIEKFEEFWKVYPKRDGSNPKQPALKKFTAAIKSGTDPDSIIGSANRYASECKSKQLIGTPMVAQAVTWLNQQRWTDYAPEQARPPPPREPPTPEQLAKRQEYLQLGERFMNGHGNPRSGETGLVPNGPATRIEDEQLH